MDYQIKDETVPIADNEDISVVMDEETQKESYKLADRAYDEANFSGKGYKILRKNIVDGKNVLTQEMINEANTVYEIRYDFDLNGQTINIPEDSTLKFEGGSLSNGNLYIINISNIINEMNDLILYNITYTANSNARIKTMLKTCWIYYDDKAELIRNMGIFDGLILTNDYIIEYDASDYVRYIEHDFYIEGRGHTLEFKQTQEASSGIANIFIRNTVQNFSMKNITIINESEHVNYSIISCGANKIYIDNVTMISSNTNRRLITCSKREDNSIYIRNSTFLCDSFIIEGFPKDIQIINCYLDSKTFRGWGGDLLSSGLNGTMENKCRINIESSTFIGGIEGDHTDYCTFNNCILSMPSYGRRGIDNVDKQLTTDNCIYNNCVFIGYRNNLPHSNPMYRGISEVRNVEFNGCIFNMDLTSINDDANNFNTSIAFAYVNDVTFNSCIGNFEQSGTSGAWRATISFDYVLKNLQFNGCNFTFNQKYSWKPFISFGNSMEDFTISTMSTNIFNNINFIDNSGNNKQSGDIIRILTKGQPLTNNSGLFLEKPTNDLGIGNGFAYFCTDKQTIEGKTDGIMIYHKGNDVWVDALGRVIS